MTVCRSRRVERWLAHLSDVDRSPNTVKAYAHDVRDFFVFLAARGLDWREVRLEDIGEFVTWLALPPEVRGGRVGALPPVQPHVGVSTVSRKLAALTAFYAHHARHGVERPGFHAPSGFCEPAGWLATWLA